MSKIHIMKSFVLSLILIIVGLTFQGCQNANHNSEMGKGEMVDTAKIDGRLKLENEIQTAMFIETVAMNNMLKVELGELAVEKASNPGVKSFGKLILRDHKDMDQDLNTLAVARGLKLSDFLGEKHLAQVEQMADMKTSYFEKLYMKMMIERYNKDIALFKSARKSPDTAISSFARKFLPVLEIQRDTAIKVQSGLTL